MEVAGPSETLVSFYHTERRDIPGDSNLHSHREVIFRCRLTNCCVAAIRFQDNKFFYFLIVLLVINCIFVSIRMTQKGRRIPSNIFIIYEETRNTAAVKADFCVLKKKKALALSVIYKVTLVRDREILTLERIRAVWNEIIHILFKYDQRTGIINIQLYIIFDIIMLTRLQREDRLNNV